MSEYMRACPCNECNNTDNKERGVTFDVALELMRLGKTVKRAEGSSVYRIVKPEPGLEMFLYKNDLCSWTPHAFFYDKDILADDWEEV